MAEPNQVNEVEETAVRQVDFAKEEAASDGLMLLVPGIVLLLIAGVLYFYQSSQGGALVGLAVVLGLIGIGLLGYGGYRMTRIRKLESHDVTCPFCNKTNHLTAAPRDDFRCVHCNREVPVENGTILQVFQVRCGYCNTLNYYSEKSTGLICEECDRAIPIATDDENQSKKVFENFTVHDDDKPYDLILVHAPKNDEMIGCLQQMLALNRNQVKDMLEELPVTLLTGIPKKKADLLCTQIAVHKGKAESSVSQV